MKRLWNWLFEKYARLLSDKAVQRKYVEAGGAIGDAFLEIVAGRTVKADDLENIRRQWEKWEAIFARRGYRPLPVDYFVRLGPDINDFNGYIVRMEKGENPVFTPRMQNPWLKSWRF